MADKSHPPVVRRKNKYPVIFFLTILMKTSFLSRDYDGMSVLNDFYCNGILCPSTKNLLVRKIISREINIILWLKKFKCGDKIDKFEISTERFTHLADQISQTFRESAAVYYTPFTKTNKLAVNASGKLWERYSTEKKNLRDTGILSFYSGPSSSAGDCTDKKLKLNWLKRSIQPWPKVVQYWLDTTKIRLNGVKENLDEQDEYFQYPCVKLQDGIALIDSDFKYLYSTKSLSLYNVRKKFETFLEKYTQYILTPKIIKKKKTNVIAFKSDKDKVLHGLVGKLPSLREDALHALGLKILTYIINPIPASAPAEKKRKLSKPQDLKLLKFEDIQESFILQVNESGDIDDKIEEKRKEAIRRNITLQPFLLLVGTEEKILNSYVVYANTKYKCDTVLDALDLNFKFFFVSNCEYPTLTRKVWLFIQEVLYNIGTDGKLGTQVESMVHYFRNNVTV